MGLLTPGPHYEIIRRRGKAVGLMNRTSPTVSKAYHVTRAPATGLHSAGSREQGALEGQTSTTGTGISLRLLEIARLSFNTNSPEPT